MVAVVRTALATLAVSSAAATSTAPPDIEVSATLECRQDPEPWIIFAVQSAEAAPLSFSPAELPWNPNGPCVVVGYDVPTGQILPRMHPIDDHFGPQSSVVLGPKQTMTGSFPVPFSLTKESPKGEVIVFWTCRVVAQGREPSRRFGGWLSFDRREVSCRIGTSNNELQRTKPAQAMELRR